MLYKACECILEEINIRLFNSEKKTIFYYTEGIKKVIRWKKYRSSLNLTDDGLVDVN